MTRKVLVPLVLPADPAAAMEAATKQYVDATRLVWSGKKASNTAFSINTWTGALSVTLTGLPVGGVAVIAGSASILSTAVALCNCRIVCTNGTLAPGSQTSPFNATVAASSWLTMPCFAVLTATGANPVVTIETHCAAGSPQAGADTHLVAWRVA